MTKPEQETNPDILAMRTEGPPRHSFGGPPEPDLPEPSPAPPADPSRAAGQSTPAE